MKIVRRNRDPVWSDKSLIKHPSTRLRFSIWVIIANFILGIIGMALGADLTALGVFLAMANAPLYAYVLGASFKPSQVPDSYFNQAHGGAGGLAPILNSMNQNSGDGSYINVSTSTSVSTQKPDEFNNPTYPQSSIPLQTVNKPKEEIG